MLKIVREGVIIKPTHLDFENLSTYNPGVLQEGNNVHIIYRAQNKDHISSLGYALLDGPLKLKERWRKPFMSPQFKYEKMGIEDPRLVKINGRIFMTYVAHDGKNALIAYATGENIYKLKKEGIISARLTYNKAGKIFNKCKLKDDYYTFEAYYKEQINKKVLLWDKDGMFFPEKIHNKYAFIHRILPDVQIAFAKHTYFYQTKEYWTRNLAKIDKSVVLEPNFGWETRHTGGGVPPIKTKHGWIFLYHGVEPRNEGRIYHTGAALLSLKNPVNVLARIPYPILSPEKKYEHAGHVKNVIFATGTAIFKGKLFIYYGASDTFVAAASVSLHDLTKELLKHRIKK
jgi:predicted GH43/DUF377 family glycosyl hydrolase